MLLYFSYAIMKYEDGTLIHQKEVKTDKENYRPTHVLPNLNRTLNSLIYYQIYPYFNNLFSKFNCGYRKGFTKHSVHSTVVLHRFVVIAPICNKMSCRNL